MRNVLLLLMISFSMTVFAEKREWQDPELNEINRAPMRAAFFAYSSEEAAKEGKKEQDQNFFSLNGMWKFNWVEHETERPVDFYRMDFEDQHWVDFPVPASPTISREGPSRPFWKL